MNYNNLQYFSLNKGWISRIVNMYLACPHLTNIEQKGERK